MVPKAYILAGGGGTRLKPLSQTGRGKLPKQFLKVIGKRTLLQEAILRIPGNYEIGVIPEKRYSEEVYRQAAAIDKSVTVIEEPYGVNTAAAILLAALFEAEAFHNPGRVLCFLPADHRMNGVEFKRLVRHAVSLAESSDCVVTIGIEPDRPETNYGYIQAEKPDGSAVPAYSVRQFVEKPDLSTAEMYLADGGYYWNAGIFIARAEVLLEKAAIHCSNILDPIRKAVALDCPESVSDAYHVIKASGWNLSIDYALMEHISDSMILVPAPGDLEWNDLGNWESLVRYMQTDSDGNASFGDEDDVIVDSQHVMVCNYTDLPLRVEGCSDLLVVATDNGILIRRRADEQ